MAAAGCGRERAGRLCTGWSHGQPCPARAARAQLQQVPVQQWGPVPPGVAAVLPVHPGGAVADAVVDQFHCQRPHPARFPLHEMHLGQRPERDLDDVLPLVTGRRAYVEQFHDDVCARSAREIRHRRGWHSATDAVARALGTV